MNSNRIVSVKIPVYEDGVDVIIDREKASYAVVKDTNCVKIKMNKAMVEALAQQLLYFSQNALPTGSHVHYNTFFCPLKGDEHEISLSKVDTEMFELSVE